MTIMRNDYTGLRRTLKSVESQKSSDVYCLVIDGSDESKRQNVNEMCSIPSDQFMVLQEFDEGIYDAMNKWKRTQFKSDLVCWLNAGDILPNEHVAKRVSADFEQRKWDWLYGNLQMINHDNEVLMISRKTPFNMFLFSMGIRWIPHEASYFTYSFLKTLGPYRKDLGVGADQEFLMRAAKKCAPHTIPDILVSMRAGGAHTQLKSIRRQLSWQTFREHNDCLFLGSKILDSFLFPLLLVLDKIPTSSRKIKS